MAAWIVYTTAPDKKTATRLAQGLVRGKLAACVTQMPGAVPIYRWKGKVARSKETLLTIQTSGRKLKALEDFLKKEHPYDLSEFIALPIKVGSRAYLAWLEEATR